MGRSAIGKLKPDGFFYPVLVPPEVINTGIYGQWPEGKDLWVFKCRFCASERMLWNNSKTREHLNKHPEEVSENIHLTRVPYTWKPGRFDPSQYKFDATRGEHMRPAIRSSLSCYSTKKRRRSVASTSSSVYINAEAPTPRRGSEAVYEAADALERALRCDGGDVGRVPILSGPSVPLSPSSPWIRCVTSMSEEADIPATPELLHSPRMDSGTLSKSKKLRTEDGGTPCNFATTSSTVVHQVRVQPCRRRRSSCVSKITDHFPEIPSMWCIDQFHKRLILAAMCLNIPLESLISKIMEATFACLRPGYTVRSLDEERIKKFTAELLQEGTAVIVADMVEACSSKKKIGLFFDTVIGGPGQLILRMGASFCATDGAKISCVPLLVRPVQFDCVGNDTSANDIDDTISEIVDVLAGHCRTLHAAYSIKFASILTKGINLHSTIRTRLIDRLESYGCADGKIVCINCVDLEVNILVCSLFYDEDAPLQRVHELCLLSLDLVRLTKIHEGDLEGLASNLRRPSRDHPKSVLLALEFVLENWKQLSRLARSLDIDELSDEGRMIDEKVLHMLRDREFKQLVHCIWDEVGRFLMDTLDRLECDPFLSSFDAISAVAEAFSRMNASPNLPENVKKILQKREPIYTQKYGWIGSLNPHMYKREEAWLKEAIRKTIQSTQHQQDDSAEGHDAWISGIIDYFRRRGSHAATPVVALHGYNMSEYWSMHDSCPVAAQICAHASSVCTSAAFALFGAMIVDRVDPDDMYRCSIARYYEARKFGTGRVGSCKYVELAEMIISFNGRIGEGIMEIEEVYHGPNRGETAASSPSSSDSAGEIVSCSGPSAAQYITHGFLQYYGPGGVSCDHTSSGVTETARMKPLATRKKKAVLYEIHFKRSKVISREKFGIHQIREMVRQGVLCFTGLINYLRMRRLESQIDADSDESHESSSSPSESGDSECEPQE